MRGSKHCPLTALEVVLPSKFIPYKWSKALYTHNVRELVSHSSSRNKFSSTMAVEVSQKTASGTQPSDVWETLQASAKPIINSGELEDLIAQLK